MPVYHMTWSELQDAFKILGIKTLKDLCAMHIKLTGYRLCEPQNLYNHLHVNGALSMSVSRSIYMLCEIVKLKKEKEQLKKQLLEAK
jgi:hypothetical protein